MPLYQVAALSSKGALDLAYGGGLVRLGYETIPDSGIVSLFSLLFSVVNLH